MVQAGQYVTDGTAVFLVTDIRDGAQVGDIKLSPILRKGYVKANGALLTSARENYPRLVTFITDNPFLNAADDTEWNSNKALYVYNSSADTLRVPDATGRVLQGGADVGMLAAGVPNITGKTQPILPGNTAATTLYSVFFDNSNGALYGRDSAIVSTYNATGVTNVSKPIRVGIDASRSNSIYGSSTTVQPPALTMIPQIKY